MEGWFARGAITSTNGGCSAVPLRRSARNQAHEILFRIAKEGHRFDVARGAKKASFVDKNNVWFGHNNDARCPQAFRRGLDILHAQVEQRRRCPEVEQESRGAHREECEPRWVERRYVRQPHHIAVEGDGTVEINGVLRNLLEVEYVHSFTVATSLLSDQ